MRIKYLAIKEGKPVELHKKITVFVGPNNSGKSQTLKDIRFLLDRPYTPSQLPIILRDSTDCFEIPDFKAIKDTLIIRPSITNVEHYTIEGIKSNLIERSSFDIHDSQIKRYDDINEEQKRKNFFQWFSKFYIALMDAETRLKLASETSSFIPSESTPENLLQSLFLKQDFEEILSKAFKDAFHQDIKLDASQLLKLCFRVGNDLDKIPEDSRTAYKVATRIPKIDIQGDGYRSFVGIILGLLLCKNRIILLDEPEAFLHPAQAYFLGKWIGENKDSLGSQLLICTHSSNFLSGILTGSQDIEIFRLKRTGNNTSYTKIEPKVASSFISNPILSSQRVIDGLFHKGVVICEADADRAVYQLVASKCHNSNREILFIHAHNKQTLALVADMLKQAGTPVAVIADIDILRPDKDLDEVYKVLTDGEIPAELSVLRRKINSYVDNRPEDEVLEELKGRVSEFLHQLELEEHNLEGARSALNRIYRETSKWSAIKKSGINVLEGDIQTCAIQLIEALAIIGLFVVPLGELEGWIDLGKHKNKWIVPALEMINDRKTPQNLSLFVGRVLHFFD